MSGLVSIIMPVYNGEQYVAEAIDSVLAQDHENWELLIINDGSQDRSGKIIQSYEDPRIHYFQQENAGVSAARNLGLTAIKGDYFCFLDGDDRLTPHSLSSRLAVFEDQTDVDFVDGQVEKWNQDFSKHLSTWNPNFKGQPLSDLVKMTGHSFFGPSWLIKRQEGKTYQMMEGLSHAEDLLFYIKLAAVGGNYSFSNETCLLYRVHNQSAMSNLKGLGAGYLALEAKLDQLDLPPSLRRAYTRKRKSIMFKSFLRAGKVWSAFRYLFS